MALVGLGGTIEGFMNRAWDRAVGLTVDAGKLVGEAVALTTPAPTAPVPAAVPDPTLPTPPTLPVLNQFAATAVYDSTSVNVVNMLTGLFSSFLSTHFSESGFVRDAQAWISRALTVGGSGVNAGVEAQLWNRARDRALTDASRARKTTEIDWAGRRFPMPPGALRHGLALIDKTAQDAIAEAARTQATEAFTREVENARIAVERAISLRSLAMSSAGEYIRTLVQGPQVAASVASTVVDAQARFSSTLVDYYRAQVTAVEIPVRVGTTNAELKARTNEANLRVAMETLGQRVSAVVANAQMVGTQAAAALNAINTQASVSGSSSDSVVTNIDG